MLESKVGGESMKGDRQGRQRVKKRRAYRKLGQAKKGREEWRQRKEGRKRDTKLLSKFSAS